MQKERFKAFVAVYLLLEQNNKLLLYLRKNTGFADGYYSCVAGHLDGQEKAIQAMIREAKEEIGIEIKAEDLQVVHIMHRLSNKEYIDIFVSCKKWAGEIQNCEPDKCESVTFAPKCNLPNNTVDYVKQAIQHIATGTFFSEVGW